MSDKACMSIDGNTKLLAVVGDPIEHTFSPYIHQILIEATGDNFAYVPFHITKERLLQGIHGAWALGIQGINVTIPHKQLVREALDRIDPEAQLVGAVNTLRWTESGYEGYNTDVTGFRKLLQLNQIPLKDQAVLIIGAGGAARSALTSCLVEGAAKIGVYNRTRERAQDMIDKFVVRAQKYGAYPIPPISSISEEELYKGEYSVVLQTTSVGMYPNVDGIPVDDPHFFDQVCHVADMVFNPESTKFVNMARERGIPAVGGLSMLFYQGAKSYEIWTQRQFSEGELETMHEKFLAWARRHFHYGQ